MFAFIEVPARGEGFDGITTHILSVCGLSRVVFSVCTTCLFEDSDRDVGVMGLNNVSSIEGFVGAGRR